MSRVLIVYDTRAGETRAIANLIAEGIRMYGAEAAVMNCLELGKEGERPTTIDH
jgi:flavodoxin